MASARAVVVVALLIGVVGCGDDGPQRADPPASTAPTATGLSPSQVTASTVAAPAGAPPCAVDELEFAAGDSVVLIRNAGAVECEVDVSQSPNRDPLMEPSIWLHPGGEGELAVEADDQGCAQPASIGDVELVVNGQSVRAPVTLAPACSVTLTAIYTAD